MEPLDCLKPQALYSRSYIMYYRVKMGKWVRIGTVYKSISVKEQTVKMLKDLFPGYTPNKAIEKLLEEQLKNGRIHITI